jgi:hypothetical protein
VLARCAGFALAAGGLIGCAQASDEQDGRFLVTASLIEGCAEGGLLAAPPTQSLHVWIRQVSERSLHWDDGGGRLVGSYEPESRTFVVERHLVVDMREAETDAPPCSILKAMQVEATLTSSPVDTASGFEGEERIDYLPTDGSSCDDLVTGEGAIATALPCTVRYELVAERE